MSVVGLRVDTCDRGSTPAQIAHCICNFDSLFTLLLCLNRAHIHVPRDLRRLIAIYCTVPTPTIMPGVTPGDYYTHYLTHPETRKYNPILHCVSEGSAAALLLTVHIESADARSCTFYHPFHKLLRGRVATAATTSIRGRMHSTVKIRTDASGARIHTYSSMLPRFGDIVIGAEYDPNVLSITITVHTETDPPVLHTLTKTALNIRSFNIPSDSPMDNESTEMFRDRIAAAYRPNYNKILGFDKFLHVRINELYIITVETREPIDALDLVYLFLPPELRNMWNTVQ